MFAAPIPTYRQRLKGHMSRVIHFVVVAKLGTDLRPVCGDWSDDVTWTTVQTLTTCPACARRLREARTGTPARVGRQSTERRVVRQLPR